jgi:hypothetical protein
MADAPQSRANITVAMRLFVLAGRPTKAQFIRVYGTPGTEDDLRAAAGVHAKHFQAALAAKGGA